MNLHFIHRSHHRVLGWHSVVAGAVVALSAFGALAHPSGADGGRENVVSFSSAATEELVQDQMTVTLQALKEGASASDVQTALKAAMDAALKEARLSAQPNGGLEIKTGGFSVFPRYGSNGKIAGWQGSAQLILEGTDMPRINQLVGRLNQLNVTGVSYGLSRALRESRETALTTQAIARFKSRALQMAKDFGFKSYSLGEISVSSTEPGFENRPPMMYAMRAKAMDAAEAALPSEPGKGVLSVTVNGSVVLQP
ncbi:MAG TPA: SIMPL domain-containing protein [Aquabacterium sp.]|nr:SIMPL domain-containing protein [Aquabacterium sp.]